MLTKHWNRLSGQLAFMVGTAIGALICLWVIGFYAYSHTYRYLHTHSDNYGKAITAMVANQAVDALINQDPISLQVILENVASQPGVLQAVVNDVNDTTIAQAGGDPTESAFAIYSAPIGLNDSIAGSISISVLPSVGMTDRQWLSLILLGTLLLLTILALGLYKALSKKKVSSIRLAISIDNTDLEKLEQTTLDTLENTLNQLNNEFHTTIVLLRARLIEISGYSDIKQAMNYSQQLINKLTSTTIIATIIIENDRSTNLHQHCTQFPLLSTQEVSQVLVNRELLTTTNVLTKISPENGPYIKVY